MKKVIIASENPVKMEATQRGFKKMFPREKFEFIALASPSEVPDQPLNNTETFQGASNRIKNVRVRMPRADFYVGIEGGVNLLEKNTEIFAWIIIESQKKIGKSKTASFYLPKKMNSLLKEGKEVGEITDLIFKTINSKQKGGSVGILTNNAVNRTSYYEDSVALALIPFKNPDLY